jgi:hypothetical protein
VGLNFNRITFCPDQNAPELTNYQHNYEDDNF